MGSQPREVDQETNSATMLRTVLALALVAVVKSQGDISQRMMRQIAQYNFRSACWGQQNADNSILELIKASEKCMQMEPSFDVEATTNPQNNPFELMTLIALSLCGETRGLLLLPRDF